ncbi:MAG: hypothetical protein JXR53_06710 [Bacteroidales bacterium]|nr:hypothetical protein [Bacteroidales bacterium]
MKNLSFLISAVFILLISCKRDAEYHYLSEEYKSVCLYYAVEIGDTIKMQNNNNDTLLLYVNNKTLDLNKMPYDNVYIEKLDIWFSHSGHSYYEIMATFNGYFEENINIPNEAQFCDIFLPNLGFEGLIELSNYSDTISGIYYSDLFKTNSVTNPLDYMITSRSQGIVYIQVDTITYERIY